MREVILLTKDDCHFCDQAKQVLASLSGVHDLTVREVALESAEGKQLAAAAAAPFPPVVFLDGECFCYGRLSGRKLRKALG
jgi:glutaredoxin